MQAIETRYLPATNTKPGRIVATNGDRARLLRSYNSALSSGQNHTNAAYALALEKKWSISDMVLVSGTVKKGMVHIFIKKSTQGGA